MAIILALVILSAGIFIFVFNKYTKTTNSKFDAMFEKTVSSINTINGSIDSVDEFDSIPAVLKVDLEEARDELIEKRNQLNGTNIPVEYTDLNKNLLSGLDNNIKLYKEILLIPSLSSSTKLQNSLEKMNDYANECVKSYASTDSSRFSVSLPENIFSIIDNMQKYVLNKKNDLQEKLIEDSQKQKHIQEIQVVYSTFLNFYQDRNKSTALESARTNNDYVKLIETLDTEVADLNSLQKKLEPIVPLPNYENVIPSLKTLMYDYVLYVQFFKHAVTFEMNAGIIEDDIKVQLEDLYNLANEKLADCEDDYSKFEEAFQKLKRD